jgi:hypothetical protein
MARGNNCGKPYRPIVSNILLILAVIIPWLAHRIGAGEVGMPQVRFKVLHIMSCHSPWEWTDEQFRGFKDVLKVLKPNTKYFRWIPKETDLSGEEGESCPRSNASHRDMEARSALHQW